MTKKPMPPAKKSAVAPFLLIKEVDYFVFLFLLYNNLNLN